MALKFLNKKGWHTGSLRNIENVWKAEQKNDAEQKKLEELRKQIQEERERSEFRLLQEQAGLVPKQERLDFLYDSGLAVGKGNSDGFKALEPIPKTDPEIGSSSTKQQQPSVPGSLFEEKPQSANDAWRKLHSDPLLLIRQREQEALARVRNNPVQMAMIRKSAEAKKQKEIESHGKKHGENHRHKKKHQKHATTRTHLEDVATKAGEKRNHHAYSKSSKYKENTNSEEESDEMDTGSKKSSGKDLMHEIQKNVGPRRGGRHSDDYQREREGFMNPESAKEVREDRKRGPHRSPDLASRQEPRHKQQNKGNKLSEEERAARLREMQMDAELHEEQRWKRLRKAEEEDAREATHASTSSGKNFLDAAHKSVYGADKGGSSTIEESVRRRTHYSQRRSQVGEGNAFRR